MTDQDALLAKIERFLNKHRMEASAFGIAVAKDNHLVFHLRDGKRKFRRRMIGKILDFMRDYNPSKCT